MLYLLICFLTIFIATRADLMYENVTGVAAMPQYRILVIIFTILSAFFYAYKVHRVYQCLNQDKKYYHWIINLTALIMSAGAFFPYTINGKDIASQLHVYCSMLSCISFLLLLFVFTRLLSYENPGLYLKIHYFYDVGLRFLCILIVVFTRVNGYTEIVFAFLVSGYLWMIEKNDG